MTAAGTRPDDMGGLEAADQAFRVLNAGTARLVQLLADELVPLSPQTLEELGQTVERINAALPHLADWQASTSDRQWILEPPFMRAGVRLDGLSDLHDIENVERLRRSLDFLAPKSLALRKEAAALVIDALLHQLQG